VPTPHRPAVRGCRPPDLTIGVGLDVPENAAPRPPHGLRRTTVSALRNCPGRVAGQLLRCAAQPFGLLKRTNGVRVLRQAGGGGRLAVVPGVVWYFEPPPRGGSRSPRSSAVGGCLRFRPEPPALWLVRNRRAGRGGVHAW